MSKSAIAFQLLQVHAETLPNHLDGSFDRIDVRSIGATSIPIDALMETS
jgi:hypothetical protein